MDKGKLIAEGVAQMELFAEGKDLALDLIARRAVLVIDREFVAPRKYFLLEIELHGFVSSY